MAQRAVINATEAPLPEGLLHTAFEAQAQRYPEQPAVVSPRARLTYAELDARANRLARRLRAIGVRPNTLVAVTMEKGWEQVVAVLGVLKAGAAYLPLDPALPPERFAWLLENAEVRIALTLPGLEPTLAWPAGVTRLMVDDQTLAHGDAAPLEPVQAHRRSQVPNRRCSGTNSHRPTKEPLVLSARS